MFVVMDTFNFPERAPMLCTDDDGETLVFDTHDEADAYGKETCQSFQVVPIGVPEVHIAVRDGVVTGALATIPMSVNVADFDEPVNMTPAEEAAFEALEKVWDELQEKLVAVY